VPYGALGQHDPQDGLGAGAAVGQGAQQVGERVAVLAVDPAAQREQRQRRLVAGHAEERVRLLGPHGVAAGQAVLEGGDALQPGHRAAGGDARVARRVPQHDGAFGARAQDAYVEQRARRRRGPAGRQMRGVLRMPGVPGTQHQPGQFAVRVREDPFQRAVLGGRDAAEGGQRGLVGVFEYGFAGHGVGAQQRPGVRERVQDVDEHGRPGLLVVRPVEHRRGHVHQAADRAPQGGPERDRTRPAHQGHSDGGPAAAQRQHGPPGSGAGPGQRDGVVGFDGRAVPFALGGRAEGALHPDGGVLGEGAAERARGRRRDPLPGRRLRRADARVTGEPEAAVDRAPQPQTVGAERRQAAFQEGVHAVADVLGRLGGDGGAAQPASQAGRQRLGRGDPRVAGGGDAVDDVRGEVLGREAGRVGEGGEVVVRLDRGQAQLGGEHPGGEVHQPAAGGLGPQPPVLGGEPGETGRRPRGGRSRGIGHVDLHVGLRKWRSYPYGSLLAGPRRGRPSEAGRGRGERGEGSGGARGGERGARGGAPRRVTEAGRRTGFGGGPERAGPGRAGARPGPGSVGCPARAAGRGGCQAADCSSAWAHAP
jgi:hypothetical protein